MLSGKEPEWLKTMAISENTHNKIKKLLDKHGLYTVCQESLCPNINECWSASTATFLLMGDTCTRNCTFCSVRTGNPGGILNPNEPENIAKAVKKLGLRYVVLTSVDRDDLEDGGAEHFSETIRVVKKLNPEIIVEALIPDFRGDITGLKRVVYSGVEVVAHNIETVRELSPIIRDNCASYDLSLEVLSLIKGIKPDIITKSSFMLGLGENDLQVMKSIMDLKRNSVDIITVGQYLQPTEKQMPVKNYVEPEKFREYEVFAREAGFSACLFHPFARSSFKACGLVKAQYRRDD